MYSRFMDGQNYITQRCIFSGGKLVGLLAPSTLFGHDETGTMHVSGRKGTAVVSPDSIESFWSALVAADCMLFGNDDEIRECIALLDDPVWSRTLSYLSTFASNCADLLRRHEMLKTARVIVVGCGGIGSLVALNLAGAGVGFITLVDPDIIELSNLNRQFFWTPSDIGRLKVDTLADVISLRYPEVQVAPLSSRADVAEIVKLGETHDAIVITADEPLGLVKGVQTESQSFVVYGGYFQSFIGYLARKGTGGTENNSSVSWSRNPFFIGPSFGPSNTELAGAVSSACIHYLIARDSINILDVSQVWRGNRILEPLGLSERCPT